jgi:hypothetical protein
VSERAPLPLRDAACEVAKRLRRAGHEAFFAGGCVRDEILGIEPADYDIATDATPARIREVFPGARDVGEAFGVMLVRQGGHTFEVATFRKDGPYLDGRRPSAVEFSTAKEDAARRDFTINGVFLRPETGEIIDYFEGQRDIAAGVVRAIGDPHARIREDRLRMLRAVRFAARFAFTIDPATAAAIRSHSDELMGVSPERIGEEVRKMLAHPERARAARLVEELALDGAIFGALRDLARAAESPRLASLPPRASWTAALAAWAIDRRAGGSRAFAPVSGVEAGAIIDGLRSSLVLSNRECDAITGILASRDRIVASFDAGSIALQTRLCAAPGFDDAILILASELRGDAARWLAMADRLLPTRILPKPLVDGSDLIAAGLRPGPRFKDLLDAALDAQLEGRFDGKPAAVDWILVRARR